MAAISGPGVVSIVAAVVTVLVLGVYLVLLALALRHVSSRLGALIAAMGKVPEKSERIRPIVQAIDADLDQTRELLERSLRRRREQPAGGDERG